MEIKINLVEAASELAHNRAKDEMMYESQVINDEEEMWKDSGSGDSIYTDQAQEVHSRWYDYFWNEIEKCKVE